MVMYMGRIRIAVPTSYSTAKKDLSYKEMIKLFAKQMVNGVAKYRFA